MIYAGNYYVRGPHIYVGIYYAKEPHAYICSSLNICMTSRCELEQDRVKLVDKAFFSVCDTIEGLRLAYYE
jgi:hypothetical protein